jgi:mannose-6-phosphate isomerase-like protein (cupin superfamily)
LVSVKVLIQLINGTKKMSEIVTRPWGTYQNILEEEYTKVKKITINPGESPSYQYHFKRSEAWIIVKGTADIKIDDNIMSHGPGDVIKIPKEAKHAITNTGDNELVFIEVQLGEYFGEDDIVRLEDKYGRV